MRADSLIAEYQGVKSIKGVSRVSREYQGSIKSIVCIKESDPLIYLDLP
jgi:hypothetical protein